MTPRLRPFSSSIGTKILIALTGLALCAFLVLHLAGNLFILAGPAAFNSYSHKLVSNPLIVPAEVGLLTLFVIHVYKALRFTLANTRARPVDYQQKKWAGGPSRKSVASTTMMWTGLLTLIFVVLHVKTFKYGAFYQATDTESRDLYRLVVEVFTKPGYVVWYVFSMILIGLHLRHGFSSALQSMGTDHPRYATSLVVLGKLFALVIAGGFALLPLWIYFITRS